jgi:sugar transferase (PEP-CTERM system associated)
MIRLFQVYYPTRTIVLLVTEAIIVSGSFLIATMLVAGGDALLTLGQRYGGMKIAAITGVTVLCSYYFDLYAPQRLRARWQVFARLLIVLGTLSFLLAALTYVFPRFAIARYVLLLGVLLLSAALVAWRGAYDWVMEQLLLRERVYVLGSGPLARDVMESIRLRGDAGMELAGWAGNETATVGASEQLASALATLRQPNSQIRRVIVAMEDRRGALPVRELLNLRLAGMVVEDSGSLLERLSGRLQLEGLRPSTLLFADGFRLKALEKFSRRAFSILVSGAVLLLTFPLLPIIALLVKLTSAGPVLFRQIRIGMGGRPFTILKFRTMGVNAECSGAVWAQANDPRVTRLGSFLRRTRIDELPQLWNVLRGDMNLVGPRPERPEFVAWLSQEIPYYDLRHAVRPGLTGWAQVRYQYGATLEETRRKLEYDLYYIKHMSLGLDLFIMFESVKTILLGRGAR